jgi:hypothetical protein
MTCDIAIGSDGFGDAHKAVEFVAVVDEIGRIQRRDGARACSSSRDIDAVDQRVERFESPTWLDDLRWRTR